MRTRTHRHQLTVNRPLPERLRALPDDVVFCELGLYEIVAGPPTQYHFNAPHCTERDHRNNKLKPIGKCGGCGRLFCQVHILNHSDCQSHSATSSPHEKEGLWHGITPPSDSGTEESPDPATR